MIVCYKIYIANRIIWISNLIWIQISLQFIKGSENRKGILFPAAFGAVFSKLAQPPFSFLLYFLPPPRGPFSPVSLFLFFPEWPSQLLFSVHCRTASVEPALPLPLREAQSSPRPSLHFFSISLVAQAHRASVVFNQESTMKQWEEIYPQPDQTKIKSNQALSALTQLEINSFMCMRSSPPKPPICRSSMPRFHGKIESKP
jgi:hypothetical protein